MEKQFEVKELAEQPVVSMRQRTGLSHIGQDIGASYLALFTYLGKSGVPPVGPPFVLYYDMEQMEDFEMEVCVPTAELLPGENVVIGRVVPGGKHVSTIHLGAYDGIGPTYEGLMQWAGEQGLALTGPAREVYLVGPGGPTPAEPEDFRTEVLIPVQP